MNRPTEEGLIDLGDSAGHRRNLLRLRWAVLIAISCLILASQGRGFSSFAPSLFILSYLVTNLIAHFLPSTYFLKRHFIYVVFLFDTSMVSLGIYLTFQWTTDFYLVYFLIIFFASIARSFQLLMIHGVVICGLYGWFLWTGGFLGEDLGRGVMSRILFLFIMNLFYGFLIQSFQERSEPIRMKGKEVEGSGERYGQIVEAAHDAVFVLDEKKRIKFFNGRLLQLTQYLPEELTGMELGKLMNGFHQEGMGENLLRDLGSEREPVLREADVLRKSGERRRVVVSLARFSPSNSQSHTIFYLKDITDRIEMEERLIQLEKLKTLGEMAAGVSHHFNNVLGAILGRVQLIKMNLMKREGESEVLPKETLHKELGVIEQAALEGAHSVKKIQEFIREQEDEFLPVPLDLNEIIEGTIELMKTKIKDEAEAKGILIQIETILGETGAVMGNPAELREVLVNLILNSVDAMPEGGTITLKTGLKNGHVFLEVIDDGLGMPESVRKRIFDPFFTTKGMQRSGLGLSVSYGIIHRHHGEIRVESRERVGTVFRIEFPIAQGKKDRGEVEYGERNPTIIHHPGY